MGDCGVPLDTLSVVVPACMAERSPGTGSAGRSRSATALLVTPRGSSWNSSHSPSHHFLLLSCYYDIGANQNALFEYSRLLCILSLLLIVVPSDIHFGMPIFNTGARPSSNAPGPQRRTIAIAGPRPAAITNGSAARLATSSNKPRPLNGATKGPPPRPEIRHKVRDKKDVVKSLKTSVVRRASPAIPTATRLQSDDEGDDSEDDLDKPRKRQKTDESNGVRDPRDIMDSEAFSTEPPKSPQIVHMEDIANIGTTQNPSDAYVPLFLALTEDEEEAPTIELRYPSSQCEKYQLVVPKVKGHGNKHSGTNDDVSPFAEIRSVMFHIAEHYMDSVTANKVAKDDSSIIAKLRRIENKSKSPGTQTQYSGVVQEFNDCLLALHKDGTLSRNLSQLDRLPLAFVEHILDQIYARTVSPQVHLVRKYKAFDDSVYGELKPRFMTRIFKETKLRSDQVFVDLGHGVGNCVLQAALEIGCESYGCEKQTHPAQLAELQEKEFPERCRMWGIKPGKVRLIHGDFLETPEVDSILKRADVVLINNQAFNPPLMDALKYKFLDLKDGCQIVCLKPFRDTYFKTREDNISDPQNKIDVTEYDRYGGDVDWADAAGKWYIHRKDDMYTEQFLKRH
jgi:[histone H3]-lysine79 N-trimethyltransferase